ncbi:succinylglutamate desuccinylase/aspartoacylase family protein [Robiginitalea sp. SC105]|nr:succinylglutamate desuccinylase/aspartoacylase family protein [Robiginitalea sp. SC105]
MGGGQSGPTLVCFGGIHGNEPAGVAALESVFAQLATEANPLEAGRFIGVRGNLAALEQGRRFLVHDLNRLWTLPRMAVIREKEPSLRSPEEAGLLEIFKCLHRILKESGPPFYFVDLHTTSSPTLPFMTINDAVINRKFAGLFPVPVILGIEEYLDGPLLSYINELGYVSLGFESGRHEDPAAVRAAEDFLWLALEFAGLMGKSPGPQAAERLARLREAARGDRNFYEVFYRHALHGAENFRMVGGFRSFQALPRGTLLAHDHSEPVYMKKKGLLFMPLYQDQGDEGFFLIRRIPSRALRLSAWLRRFRFQDVLPVLPGIRWAAPGSQHLLVNLRVARFFSKKLFHLLGFRSKQKDRTHLLLSNRERTARNEDYAETFWFRRKFVRK